MTKSSETLDKLKENAESFINNKDPHIKEALEKFKESDADARGLWIWGRLVKDKAGNVRHATENDPESEIFECGSQKDPIACQDYLMKAISNFQFDLASGKQDYDTITEKNRSIWQTLGCYYDIANVDSEYSVSDIRRAMLVIHRSEGLGFEKFGSTLDANTDFLNTVSPVLGRLDPRISKMEKKEKAEQLKKLEISKVKEEFVPYIKNKMTLDIGNRRFSYTDDKILMSFIDQSALVFKYQGNVEKEKNEERHRDWLKQNGKSNELLER